MAKTLAEDLKWRIILLHNDGYSKRQIANLLYIGETLVKKVIHIYAKWGCVVNPWKLTPGRKKVFSRSDMNVLRDIVHEHVDYYLDEYIEEMQARTGKRVSVSTLWRSLAYCGITRKKLHKAALERNELLRGVFIASIGHYRIDQLVFMDESSKDERTSTCFYGYSEINSKAIKKVVFIRGKRYTLLPALTKTGIIAVDIMEGSCTKQRFKEFVVSQVLPQMNPFPSTNSVLVLDNAKIHHDQELLEYLDAFGK
ncbi:homeodomain-like protein [Rhizophagus clarus]|uniref:Homeodomain-like protein n=1 Tax=Rhizophagus clarus TaxID=94130 RepID=A0A8H3LZD5_9GLOM|nr:homeodomain-like protein [Rhizophagus clarus]